MGYVLCQSTMKLGSNLNHSYLNGNTSRLIQSSGMCKFHSQRSKPVESGHGDLSRVWPGNKKSITTRHTQICEDRQT